MQHCFPHLCDLFYIKHLKYVKLTLIMAIWRLTSAPVSSDVTVKAQTIDNYVNEDDFKNVSTIPLTEHCCQSLL